MFLRQLVQNFLNGRVRLADRNTSFSSRAIVLLNHHHHQSHFIIIILQYYDFARNANLAANHRQPSRGGIIIMMLNVITIQVLLHQPTKCFLSKKINKNESQITKMQS